MALASHPLVAAVVVTGRDSDRWGQEVVAIVALTADAATDCTDLIAHALRPVSAHDASRQACHSGLSRPRRVRHRRRLGDRSRTSVALTQRGGHVAAWDVNAQGLSETQAACGTERVSTYQVDVADPAAVLAGAEQVRQDLQPASMVFNNAGVDLYAGVAEMSWPDYDWLIGVNLGAVVNGTKAFLPQLVESGRATTPSVLVNLSSAFGLIAVPYQGAYSTSKFAAQGYVELLARGARMTNSRNT